MDETSNDVLLKRLLLSVLLLLLLLLLLLKTSGKCSTLTKLLDLTWIDWYVS
jgi:hypothetical protein